MGIFGAPERLSLPSTPEEGAALARRYRKLLWKVMFWGNIVAALPAILGTLTSAPLDPDPVNASRRVVYNLIAVAVWIGLFFGPGVALNIRSFCRPVAAWLTSARAPTTEERTAVSRIPRDVAVWSAIWWGFDVLWLNPLNLFVLYRGVHVPPVFLMQGVVAVVAGGTTGAILTYLLAERAMRPLTGLAMRDFRSHSRFGALSRLLMGFAAGIAVPIAAMAIGLIGLNERQRAAAAPTIWVGLVAVTIAGFVVAFVAARALTDPLQEVRSGLARLKGGEFDVELEVNEPGELGELQAGFNDLAAELRERNRMREVFTRLVGKEVVERALSDGTGLTGRRCEATALFVDVVGSTPLAQLSNEFDYWTQLNRFFDVVVRCVEQDRGFVNQFQGDGALCVFGAPVKQDDHAARALHAARVLRCDLDAFAEKTGINAVIGLSTGNVVAGYVGGAERYEFTVVGDAVNEAKRLADEAKATETKILVSEATIRAAEGEVANWRETDTVHLRGRAEPTTTFAPRAGDGNR